MYYSKRFLHAFGGREGRNKCNSLVAVAVRTDVLYKIEFIDIEVLFFNL